MSTYNTGFISTGKIDANTVNVYDSSGSTSAALRAVQINAGNVSASVVNADNFTYTTLGAQVNTLTVDTSANINNLVVNNNIKTKSLSTNSGTGIDASGNLTVVGTTIFNNLSLNTLRVDSSANIANLNVTGTAKLNGVNIATLNDISGAIAILTNGADSALDTLLEIDNYIKDTSNNLGNVITNLNYKAPLANPNFTGLVDVSGNLNVSLNIRASTMDVSGNLNVKGQTTLNKLVASDSSLINLNVGGIINTKSGFSVDSIGSVIIPSNAYVLGQAQFSNNVLVKQNLAVQANEYIAGNLYSNNGVVVGDSVNGLGVQMDSIGNNLLIRQKDISGNVTQANVVLNGTVSSVKALSTTSGTGVDLSGNLTVVGNVTNASNMSVGGESSLNNVVINGNSTLNNLDVLNGVAVEGNVNITESNSVSGGLYVEGKVYSNNGFVVGDTDYGDGVTLISGLGTNVLNVVGVTQDLSYNVFPVNMNVGGSLSLTTDSSSTVLSTTLDSSGGYVFGINSPNATINDTNVPDYKIKIRINDEDYWLNLKKIGV